MSSIPDRAMRPAALLPHPDPPVVPPPPVEAPAVPPAPAAPPPATAAPPAPPPARRPRVSRRVLVVAGVVLLVAAGVWFALRPSAVAVDMARATVGDMRVTVDADALTRVRGHFTVSAPVAGLLQRITLREGDQVSAGQAVAFVAVPPTQPTERRASTARLAGAAAARQQAAARVAQAAALLAQAERDAERARQLVAAGALAPREGETARVAVATRRADLATARAQVRVAEADMAQARAAVDAAVGANGAMTVVHAPVHGRVLRVNEPSARVVPPGTPLLEIGDVGSLEVAADVLSGDAAMVRPGQPVTLTGWGATPLQGVVRTVEPSARTRLSALGVEEQRLTVVIDIANPPAALGDGFKLQASIVVWPGHRVLTAPASALLRTDDRWEVYAVRDGRARRRVVRVGHVGGGKAEVTAGLAAGDSVVVFPPEDLRDGGRVKPAP